MELGAAGELTPSGGGAERNHHPHHHTSHSHITITHHCRRQPPDDEYLVDFTSWRPGRPPAAAFAVPNGCPPPSAVGRAAGAGAGAVSAARAARVAQAAALMPWRGLAQRRAARGVAAADAADAPAANAAALRRLAARAEAARFVAAHDAAAAGYSVALNHLASVAPDEYAALWTARRGAPAASAASAALKARRALGVFSARGVTKEMLPRSVDWRRRGAVGVVKDQATCGSCWAFAATGTMEGAWNAATGEAVSLSEQQLVDCSWDYGNNGCGGGNMEPAIQYVADVGGAWSEEAYQYLGAFCLGRCVRGSLCGALCVGAWGRVSKGRGLLRGPMPPLLPPHRATSHPQSHANNDAHTKQARTRSAASTRPRRARRPPRASSALRRSSRATRSR